MLRTIWLGLIGDELPDAGGSFVLHCKISVCVGDWRFYSELVSDYARVLRGRRVPLAVAARNLAWIEARKCCAIDFTLLELWRVDNSRTI